ncbi:replication initiation protein [Burkholderia multivorans]|uniref:replication initiation protein n=1 Tax=Burkholderia multivorans TaxID=87883 RepID=UPI001C2528AF|nr:replication initiation protein [Burkholderia multivorans]MBU9348664.1 replication initiation protein [Burkholderia multivorans]
MHVADQEQLDLFDAGRWPRKPYCTNDLAAGLRVRSLQTALTHSYIQANPPHLRVWSIHDIDRQGGVLAWEDADLPPPTWASKNKTNGHAHLVWGLSAPVLVEGMGARDAPMRYLCAVESLMRAKLEADAGYAGLITKNPSHPLWETLRGPRLAYELSELAEYLPNIEKHLPRRRVEEVGLGRNITLFDRLRKWAYANVRDYKGGGLETWNAWLSLANSQALTRNADFANPLDGREVWHIAKSVAKWTYRHFDVEASDARFHALQSHRGKKGNLAKWGNNEDKQTSARLMAAAGKTVREIAAELGVGKSTVARWTTER